MRYFRHALALATLAILPLSVVVAETAKTTSTTAKKKSTATAKKKTASGSAATSATRHTSTTKRRTATSVSTYRAPSRARQMQPTPERYKEIQQALAGKGYLKSEPSGVWDQESVDAMRRFQEDQNINPSGKIDSLSLIALGLGPKRPTGATPPPPPAEPKPEPPPPAGN